MTDVAVFAQIVSVVVILLALGVSYGKLSSKVEAMGKQIEKINGCVADNRKDIASNTAAISRLKEKAS